MNRFRWLHGEHCGWQPISESELPLTLPPVPDYHPNDEGESPLSKAGDEWLYASVRNAAAKRGVKPTPCRTGPGLPGISCVIAIRITSQAFASKEALDYWMNVDWYNGGMEHTTLHLLYSRFGTNSL